ncbi:MAG: bifunctional hydroxymethylpyrimidine kinase/phosphomethylpyrimidine kinase [Pseudomonadota bacterium]
MTIRPVIVAISSHVARGTVGNRIITPVLESHGFDVWAVPTVLLPFHPGIGRGVKAVTEEDAFASWLNSLSELADGQRIVGVISGYFGSVKQIVAVREFVTRLRDKQSITYLCDPVMGDANGLYVPLEIAGAIQAELVPIADVITPNIFEFGWLKSGRASAMPIDEVVSKMGHWSDSCRNDVIVTSAEEEGRKTLSRIGNISTSGDKIRGFVHAKVLKVPSGTGDMFSAAYLGYRLGGHADPLRRATSAVWAAVKQSAGDIDLSMHGHTEDTESEILEIDFGEN